MPVASLPPYLQQAAYQPIIGSCRATIRPDRAVIVGGMAASGLKPTEAGARLERMLDALKALADEVNGTLRMVERVRATRPSNPRARRDSDVEPEPYIVLQRFELELEVGADVDRVLERTLQTGLNRYGSSAAIDGQTGRSQPLVVYRFTELDALLRTAHEQCRRTAVRSWCEAQAGADAGSCVATLEAPTLHVATDRLVLRSQPVTRADGNVDAVQLTWPFADAAGLEIGGDAELVFSGEISLRLSPSFR